MAITNSGNWCQATVSTGAVGIRTATNILRRCGFKVVTSSMGLQVTSVGSIKMTLIDIRPGSEHCGVCSEKHGDTFCATKVLQNHIPELRD